MNDSALRELILEKETSVDFYHEARQGVTSRREAIDELEDLLEFIEDDFRRGVVLDLLGRRSEAREVLSRCQHANPLCMHLLGKLLLEEGNSSDALQVLDPGWNQESHEPRVGMLYCEALILE